MSRDLRGTAPQCRGGGDRALPGSPGRAARPALRRCRGSAHPLAPPPRRPRRRHRPLAARADTRAGGAGAPCAGRSAGTVPPAPPSGPRAQGLASPADSGGLQGLKRERGTAGRLASRDRGCPRNCEQRVPCHRAIAVRGEKAAGDRTFPRECTGAASQETGRGRDRTRAPGGEHRRNGTPRMHASP